MEGMERKLLTIGEYAKKNGVSVQAVNQAIKRYQKEFEGHIVKQGNVRCLDEQAIEILDKHKRPSQVVVMNESTDDVDKLKKELERLKKENEALKAKKEKAFEALAIVTIENKDLKEQLKMLPSPKEDGIESPSEAPGRAVTKDNQTDGEVRTKEENATQSHTEAQKGTSNRFVRAWKELTRR